VLLPSGSDTVPIGINPIGQSFIGKIKTNELDLYLFLGFNSTMKPVCGYSTGLMHQSSLLRNDVFLLFLKVVEKLSF